MAAECAGGADGEEVSAEEEYARLVRKLIPPLSFDDNAREAMSAVADAAREAFGDEASVLPFGSLVQSLQLLGSDLDLCIEVPALAESNDNDNSAKIDALKKLMGKLPGSFRVVETRLRKTMKVPIVILAFTSSSREQVEADICIGAETDGVPKGFTDRIVRRLLSRLPKALHLARLVKLWARVEKLNKAYDGFLNSLGWTLMVLFFYIERGEVISNDMHVEEPNENGPDGDGSLPPRLHSGGADEAELDEVPSHEEAAEFFEWLTAYWATWPEEAPNNAWGISLVDSTIVEVPSASKQWSDTCSFFIEDPGVRLTKGTSENVARSLKTVPWRKTLERCDVAAVALRESIQKAKSWINRLLFHVESERKAKAAPAQMLAAQTLAAQRVGTWTQKRPCEPVLPAAKRPRTEEICRWFLMGECWSGDRCTKSHG